MTNGEHVMETWPESKFHSFHEYVQSMCSKFQIPASNTVGAAETRTELQCNMVEICKVEP